MDDPRPIGWTVAALTGALAGCVVAIAILRRVPLDADDNDPRPQTPLLLWLWLGVFTVLLGGVWWLAGDLVMGILQPDAEHLHAAASWTHGSLGATATVVWCGTLLSWQKRFASRPRPGDR